MFCPTCGQQQSTGETRFCSKCGFLLTGTFEVVANGGVLPVSADGAKTGDTPRKKGLKQGLFIFLLAFLIVPIIVILTVAVKAPPYGVVISAVLLTVGGLLRAAYALMFESNEPLELSAEHNTGDFAAPMFGNKNSAGSLPPPQSVPVSVYAAPEQNWRETNDLASPPSVTDNTTRHLQRNAE